MVARGPLSTGDSRTVGAGRGRWTTSPAGRVRGGRCVRAGPRHGTAALTGGVRSGHRRSAPPTRGPVAGRRGVGQGLLSGGARRGGPDGATTGRCVRAGVDRRADGPAGGGAFRGRVWHGEPTGRLLGEVSRPGGRRRTATPGRWTAVSAVDHRQAGVGVWQAAGLAEPVRGPLRAVQAGFAAGRRSAAGPSANAVPMVVCTAPTWTEGPTYQAGAQV
ncbi:hypothetical protein ACWD8I_28560, partial [Micromonospora arida]